MKTKLWFLLAGLLGVSTVSAQLDNIGVGFRAGLSASRFDGPLETNSAGESLESYTNTTGFHLGMLINFRLTDLVGIRTELTFSQRGTEHDFDGDSYYLIGRNTSPSLILPGRRTQSVRVTNTYLDVPVLGYYRAGRIEIMGGFNAGLLIGSSGGGNLTYAGKSPLTGNNVNPFEINFQHNYFGDEAGEGSDELQEVSVDGKVYSIPDATGAYYEFAEKDKALYRSLDLSLVGSLAFYLNDGLFLSARYMHGLSDVDRNEYDVSLQALEPNGEYIRRADKNTGRTWQFSLGFSF